MTGLPSLCQRLQKEQMIDPKRAQQSDVDLVLEAQSAPAGDMRAFAELVRRYREPVNTNCRYMSGSPTDAEDLAQEVFVKAFFGLRRFEGRSSFETWVKRIKANHCINFLKKRSSKSFVDVEDPGVSSSDRVRVEPTGLKGLDQLSKRKRIQATLDSLPETTRIPLILRDMDGLRYQDIAEELGVGLSAAKMRVKRGREAFRALYGDREVDE